MVTMHESFFGLKFQLKDAIRVSTGRPHFDVSVLPQLPTDQWMKSFLSRNSTRHWELIFYAWLHWKKYFMDERFHWLVDFTFHQDTPPLVMPPPLNNSQTAITEDVEPAERDGTEEVAPVVIPESSTSVREQLPGDSSSSRCQPADSPLDSISELCSINPPPDDTSSVFRPALLIPPSPLPASPPLASPHISPLYHTNLQGFDSTPDLPNGTESSPPSPLSPSVSLCAGQPTAELEMLQAKAQYYKLKNARKILRDLKKGKVDESLFSPDELRELRKRCYQAMVDS